MTNEGSGKKKNTHVNDETTVRCPVEGCDTEVLSRALHLHVGRSVGDGHGERGVVPENVDLDAAEEVGTKTVEMEYPESRPVEGVQRLCPYCERPFQGKEGVIIHIGAMAGRKDHPEDGPKRHEPDDFAVVTVDENGNVIEVVEEGTQLPSTERRQEREESPLESVSTDDVREHIESLREQGLDKEAEQAEQLLLGE